MIPMNKMNRRSALRGMMGGGAVTLGLPFLDCFLNTNGTALADGSSLPVCFSSWYYSLGLTPGFWEPKTVGANFEFGPQLKPLTPFRDKINVFSGLKAYLDGRPVQPHQTGWKVAYTGGVLPSNEALASIDAMIAETVGKQTRFRSLEVSSDGSPSSHSQRAGSSPNPAEGSPVAFYMRVFGPEFKDPNAAEFTPDPSVILRRSALSMVSDERQSFLKQVGASDRARLDEYFTSLRSLENQLELTLKKPEPLKACSVPEKPVDGQTGPIIDDVLRNHDLMARLMAHALACGQTRVANVEFSNYSTRRAASPMTYHIYTHEEAIDEKLGYQPNVAWFQDQTVAGFLAFLKAMDGIKEGEGTLLDRMLVMAYTDHSYAKIHGLEGIPVITAGKAGGRMKTGIHVQAKSDPLTRVGLTLQQVMGVPVADWGYDSNKTSKTITDVMA